VHFNAHPGGRIALRGGSNLIISCGNELSPCNRRIEIDINTWKDPLGFSALLSRAAALQPDPLAID